VIIVATLGIFLPVDIAHAREQSATIQVAVTIPTRGVDALGVLTLMYDDADGEGTWKFDGSIAGEPASAAGAMLYEDDSMTGSVGATPVASGAFKLTVTSIDSWNFPLGQPDTPVMVNIRTAGDIATLSYEVAGAAVFGVPYRLSPAGPLPLAGQYTLADLDATVAPEPEETLPATGQSDATGLNPPQALAVGFAFVGVVLLLVAAIIWNRRTSRHAPNR